MVTGRLEISQCFMGEANGMNTHAHHCGHCDSPTRSRLGISTLSDQGEAGMAGLKHATPRLRPGDHAVT